MYNPQLDTFIKVAETGSFSRAASALYITPTAVIKQMNLLETRLGLTLFRRSHQGLTLTAAGESLLVDARHIVKYAQQAVDRAQAAGCAEQRVVRVGVSLVTPLRRLSRSLARVHELHPEWHIQLVTFENTPHAPRDLANLGHDIDVIFGLFDDTMLAERGCAALELGSEPLCCAVPIESDLAQLERITLDDLRGHTLMTIVRGWNRSTDALRDLLHSQYPDIVLEDFPQYRAEAFNRCATSGAAMVSAGLWGGVHPLLKTLPTDWGLSIPYGALHAPNPSEHVRAFLDELQACEHEARG